MVKDTCLYFMNMTENMTDKVKEFIMKLPCEKPNGQKLYVFISGNVYANNIYEDFGSKKELDEYMLNQWGVKKHQYSYWYGM